MFGNGQTKWPVQSVRSKRANTTVNADIYMAHGINEYSGRTATAASVHLRNGFRVIGIDMPSLVAHLVCMATCLLYGGMKGLSMP